ncbi:atherin-like [Panicum hallii]|uniref:atherin-like n=1 Tax=Panicum hallii TaxID=206008 RepID=UPI000DF4D0FA|nr:atherin-like [Panicum hallii]
MELVEALPLVPRGRRVVRKRKAFVVEPTSPSASPPNPKRQNVVGAKFAGDDVPAGGSAETTRTDPSTTSAGVVTVAEAGTAPGHLAPSAGVTPPPATSTMVIKPRALRLKKSGMKKSSLTTSALGLNEPEPDSATPAPEPPAPKEDATLPDPPPPEPQQPKLALVVMNKPRPLMPLLRMAQVPHCHQLKKLRVPQATLEICWCPGEDTRTSSQKIYWMILS